MMGEQVGMMKSGGLDEGQRLFRYCSRKSVNSGRRQVQGARSLRKARQAWSVRANSAGQPLRVITCQFGRPVLN